MASILEMIESLMGMLHTFIRFIPLGIYSFAYLNAAIFKDTKGAIILLGLIINDFIGFVFKRYFKFEPNAQCAIFGNKTGDSRLGFLPNAHTEMVALLTAFFYSDMWAEYKMDFIPFVFMLLLLLLTLWSRISIGCKTLNDAIFNIIVGAVLGMLYYYFVKDRYSAAKRGHTVRESCDMGYNNFKCNEIKDGTVILKNPKGPARELDDVEEEEPKSFQGWYDSA